MSDISNEVSELCDSILIFEKYTNKLKEELFLYPEVCDVLIWNHMIGGEIETVHKENIHNFLTKKHTKINNKTLDLLMYEYSIKKLNYLTRQEFIFIFIDQRRKGIYEILEARKRKFSYASNHEPHYKISEILTEILTKTFEFLEKKEEIKQNIFAVNQEPSFKLEKVDSSQEFFEFYESFLIFINKFQPLWGIEECEIVLSHILKLRKKELKEFYFFFVPYECKSKKLNPDKNILKKSKSLEINETYSSMIDHKKVSHFGNKNIKLKKTLYLK